MLFRSDRKSTRLNSSHTIISYAVFCLKKKTPTPAGPASRRGGRRAPLTRGSTTCRGGRVAVWGGAVGGATGAHVGFVVVFFFLMIGPPPVPPLFPSTTLCR